MLTNFMKLNNSNITRMLVLSKEANKEFCSLYKNGRFYNLFLRISPCQYLCLSCSRLTARNLVLDLTPSHLSNNIKNISFNKNNKAYLIKLEDKGVNEVTQVSVNDYVIPKEIYFNLVNLNKTDKLFFEKYI